MSTQDDADKLLDLAKSIFIIMAGELGFDHWDWEPVAAKAFEAAQEFTDYAQERLNPQQSIPAPDDAATATSDPSAQPPTPTPAAPVA
jgi:hypothetical protein